MKKINTNYNQDDVEELTRFINKKYNSKSTIRKMRKNREDKQMYETPVKRDI